MNVSLMINNKQIVLSGVTPLLSSLSYKVTLHYNPLFRTDVLHMEVQVHGDSINRNVSIIKKKRLLFGAS